MLLKKVTQYRLSTLLCPITGCSATRRREQAGVHVASATSPARRALRRQLRRQWEPTTPQGPSGGRTAVADGPSMSIINPPPARHRRAQAAPDRARAAPQVMRCDATVPVGRGAGGAAGCPITRGESRSEPGWPSTRWRAATGAQRIGRIGMPGGDGLGPTRCENLGGGLGERPRARPITIPVKLTAEGCRLVAAKKVRRGGRRSALGRGFRRRLGQR